MKFLNNLLLEGNELQNAVLQNLGAAPGNFPKAGRFWFDTRTTRNDGGSSGAYTMSAFPHLRLGISAAGTEASYKTVAYLDDLDTLATNLPSTILALPLGNIFVGNASNVAQARPTTFVPISAWGPALSDVIFGNVNGPGFRLEGVANPVLPFDAVNKGYVDNLATGMLTKAAVDYATTAALPANTINAPSALNGSMQATANGALVIDGVPVALGDRILVKDQPTAGGLARMNGIYDVLQTGSAYATWLLNRSPDANGTADGVVKQGITTSVLHGAVNGGTQWALFTPNPITLNTTDQLWQLVYASQDLVAGKGLVKTGLVLDVELEPSTLSVLGFYGTGDTATLGIIKAAGPSVLGQVNAAGIPAWLGSTTVGHVMRISAGPLAGFGQLLYSELGGVPTTLTTIPARTVLGNATAGALSAPGHVTSTWTSGKKFYLQDTGAPGTLAFGVIPIGDLPDPIGSMSGLSVLGKFDAGAGTPAPITATTPAAGAPRPVFLSDPTATAGLKFSTLVLRDLPDIVNTSVLGNATLSTGVVSVITATTIAHVLTRRSGGLVFDFVAWADLSGRPPILTTLPTLDPGGIIYAATASAFGCNTHGNSGEFSRSGGTGAPTWFNLFAAQNTWTARNEFNDGSQGGIALITIDGADRGTVGANPSNLLQFFAKAFDTAAIDVEWEQLVRVNGSAIASNAGTDNTFVFKRKVGAGAVADVFGIGGGTMEGPKIAATGGFLSGITFNWGAGAAGECYLKWTGVTASRTIDFPNLSGTVALTTNSVFGIGSTWNGNPIAPLYGGTGSALVASIGTLLYGDGTNFVVANLNPATTAIYPTGTEGYVLQSHHVTAPPKWFNLFGTQNIWTETQVINRGFAENGVANSGTNAHLTKVSLVMLNDALTSVGYTDSPGLFLAARAYSTAANNLYGRVDLNVVDTVATGYWRFRLNLKLNGSYNPDVPDANDREVIKFSKNEAITSWVRLKFRGDVAYSAPTETGFTGYTSTFWGLLDTAGTLTANRTWTLPDATGFLLVGDQSLVNFFGNTGTIAASPGGLMYGTSPSGMRLGAAGITGQIPLSGGAGAPTWSTYTMPTTMAANTMFVVDTANQVRSMASVPNAVMVASAAGVHTWLAPTSNAGTGGATGMARKFSVIAPGNNTTSIVVTHNLNTRDVAWSIRTSDISDSATTQDFVMTDVQVTSNLNTLTFNFSGPVPPTTYYKITVVG